MIFQPLLENAIWHGIVPSQQKGIIKISPQQQGDKIQCDVRDNGVGIINKKSTTGKQHISMAINIVRE